MPEEWVRQMQNEVDSLEKLETYINVTDDEKQAIEKLNTKWGVTPYFASLMDKDDPDCPIRKQVIPSMQEKVNEFGMDNYPSIKMRTNMCCEIIREKPPKSPTYPNKSF